MRTAWRLACAAAIVVLATSVAACGESTSDSGSAGAGPASEFPVRVAGKLGTAEITAPPRKVVALDWTSADIAVALGVTPVAMAQVRLGTDSGVQPWTERALHGATPALFGTDDGDPVQKILSYQPDLILATKDYNLADSYPQLARYVPVVGYRDAPNSDTWQQSTRSIAAALGLRDKGEQLIARTRQHIAATAKRNPALRGTTFNFLVSPGPSSVYTVNSTRDVSTAFLADLGLTLSPAARGLPDSEIPGRAIVSYENIQQLDTRLLLSTGPPASLRQIRTVAGFRALDAVRAGHYVELPPTLAQAIAFPSPPSLDWALDRLVPDLTTALRR